MATRREFTVNGTIRIENVRIFDSRAAVMAGPHDVEIAEGTIRSILAPGGAPPSAPAAETVLDGTGRTLIPGLIDAHWHAAFTAITPTAAMAGTRDTCTPPPWSARAAPCSEASRRCATWAGPPSV